MFCIFFNIPLSQVQSSLSENSRMGGKIPNNPLSVLIMVQEADIDSRLWPETEGKKLPFLMAGCVSWVQNSD